MRFSGDRGVRPGRLEVPRTVSPDLEPELQLKITPVRYAVDRLREKSTQFKVIVRSVTD